MSDAMPESAPQQTHWLGPMLVILIGTFMALLDSSIVNAVLNRRIAMHTEQLRSGVTSWNPNVIEFAQKAGAQLGGLAGGGKTVVLAYLQALVAKAAYVQGIDEVFIVSAALTLAAVIPALFLKKNAASRSAATGRGAE